MSVEFHATFNVENLKITPPAFPDRFNVCLPFDESIYKFNTGQKIRIIGTPTYPIEPGHDIYRFIVDLVTENDDIYFQLHTRFHEGVVVRNQRVKNKWKTEDRFGGFPFRHDEVFTLDLIALENNRVKIFVNGVHFSDFQSESNSNNVSKLVIYGDLTVHLISVSQQPCFNLTQYLQ